MDESARSWVRPSPLATNAPSQERPPRSPMKSLLHRHLAKVQRVLAQYEQASRDAQLATPAERLDTRVIGVLVSAAIIVSLLNYFGGSSNWSDWEVPLGLLLEEPGKQLARYFLHDEYGRLLRLAYWSGTTVIGYFVVPVLLIRFLWKRRLADFGLPFPGSSSPFGLGLVLAFIMLPFVLVASFTESFQSSYPFYEFADRSAFDFLAWQLLYAAQFFALEFFYRGFLIHGLKHRFGIYSILVSTVPYVMIHFGKPLPETLGSVVAGIALGALSYHYRSVWPCVFLHILIAFSMDVFSLSAQGRIGLF